MTPFTHTFSVTAATVSKITTVLFSNVHIYFYREKIFKSHNNKIHRAVYYHLFFFVERIILYKIGPSWKIVGLPTSFSL